MSRDAVILFLSLLAVGAQLTIVIAIVCALVGGSARRAFVDTIGPHATLLALVVAAIAMAGSLYFSEVAHFTPCKLCWYQRIAMYPLVPMLLLAEIRRRDDVWPYTAVLAALGGCVSIYHVLLERFPSLETGACDPNNPCSLIWTKRFGYLTIPTMALSAFALILTLLATGVASGRAWRRESAHEFATE